MTQGELFHITSYNTFHGELVINLKKKLYYFINNMVKYLTGFMSNDDGSSHMGHPWKFQCVLVP